MFVTVGMSEVAVSCFLKAGQTKEAIDACVQLNQVYCTIPYMYVCHCNHNKY